MLPPKTTIVPLEEATAACPQRGGGQAPGAKEGVGGGSAKGRPLLRRRHVPTVPPLPLAPGGTDEPEKEDAEAKAPSPPSITVAAADSLPGPLASPGTETNGGAEALATGCL